MGVRVIVRHGQRFVEHEKSGLEAEAVFLDIILVLVLIPSPVQSPVSSRVRLRYAQSVCIFAADVDLAGHDVGDEAGAVLAD